MFKLSLGLNETVGLGAFRKEFGVDVMRVDVSKVIFRGLGKLVSEVFETGLGFRLANQDVLQCGTIGRRRGRVLKKRAARR